MIKTSFSKKTIALALRQKIIRIMLILSLLLIVICAVLLAITFTYNNRIRANDAQISDVQTQLKNLQTEANATESAATQETLQERALAPYDQIVPFINFLESLFAIIDKDSKITIKDEENQIRINRYADYNVVLSPGDKLDLFLKALDGLYKSKYLTKIINFEISYSPTDDGKNTKISEIDLTIRLYFE